MNERGEFLAEAVAAARYLWSLPGFLRRPVSSEEARARLLARFERRESNFLALLRRTIWESPDHPYRQLLELAGCQPGDLERLVAQEGVEGTLRALLQQGVYLTVDEFKGRRPARRGSASVTFDPARLRNRRVAAHFFNQSGGSRGPRTRVPVSLTFIREHGVNWRLVLEARGCGDGPDGQWLVPGGQALINLLEAAAHGSPLERWFTQVDPTSPGLQPRYRWAARLTRQAGRLAGVRIPRLEYAPPEAPRVVAGWLADGLRAGRRPHLLTPASGAVRVCEAALQAGFDLRGAQFSVGGEPLTAARLEVVRRAGADACTTYASSETMRLGYGCLARHAPDELHLYHDLVAMVQPGADDLLPGLPAATLLVTALSPHAPLTLLNVSLGDQAELSTRACGCPLERLGWSTHLRQVRSFEKLNAGGMTVLDSEVVRVLEEILPARFGGGPLHYQLVESETAEGHPRLRLLIHPDVGAIDEAAAVDAFLSAIGSGGGAARVTELLWRGSRQLGVERRSPYISPAGKVLHLFRESVTRLP